MKIGLSTRAGSSELVELRWSSDSLANLTHDARQAAAGYPRTDDRLRRRPGRSNRLWGFLKHTPTNLPHEIDNRFYSIAVIGRVGWGCFSGHFLLCDAKGGSLKAVASLCVWLELVRDAGVVTARLWVEELSLFWR